MTWMDTIIITLRKLPVYEPTRVSLTMMPERVNTSLWLSDAISHTSMATLIVVNISSGNGLVPDSTEPLPEQMLTSQ